MRKSKTGQSAKARVEKDSLSDEATLEQARQLASRFKTAAKSHHKQVHSIIADAAYFFKDLKDSATLHAKWLRETYWQESSQKPKGLDTSFDVLCYATGAITNDERREAGRYARAVDYMISKKINDYEKYLNQHGYTRLVDAARQGKTPAQVRSDKEKQQYIRVYLDNPSLALQKVLENRPTDVAFDLHCRLKAGPKRKVSAWISPVVKNGEDAMTADERGLTRQWLLRMSAAEGELLRTIKPNPRRKRAA